MENPRYEKLKTLLKELFQLDQPDLDFGIYRIMHAKSAEVNKFLDEELLPQITAAFSQYSSADRAQLEKELARAIEQAKNIGVDPETTPKVQELRQKIATDAVDIVALESEVYDHLYSFFRRYYSEGDFLSKRVYKEGVYAIPYEGEEVKLYWANYDQYYIKTSEYLRDYSFMFRADNEKNPMRVHFRLVDGAEGEHDNVKEQQGRERRFKLVEGNPVTLENNELIVRFTYQTEPETQKGLNQNAETAILVILKNDTQYHSWLDLLSAKHRRSDGSVSDNTRLRVHLDRYTARNTFDYFIHKDLGSFLRRELDFYIKNEVMHLDDIEDETAPRVEQYLSKIKVIRTVAGKIIDFLAQLENFQKKLWLKKKFVYETDYCIRLGIIPETFYHEIAGNRALWEEWDSLLHFDADVFKEEQNTLFSTSAKPQTVEFLKAHPTLMLDTHHFTADFTARLLETFDNLDEQTDGILIHSENFQALNLLQKKYQEKIKCVYIDPPYNTQSSEILYKNTYKHSSWLSLIQNRLALSNFFLGFPFVYVIAIDEVENYRLGLMISEVFQNYDDATISIVHNPTGQQGNNFSFTHEFAHFIYPRNAACIGFENRHDQSRESAPDIRPLRNVSSGKNHLRNSAANCFYPIYVNNGNIIGFGDVCNADFHPKGANIIMPDGTIEVYPIDPSNRESKWVFARDTVESIRNDLYAIYDEKKMLWDIIRKKSIFRYKSLWNDKRYSANSWGSALLNNILPGTLFTYPKSIYTVRDCIDAAMNNSDNGTILDYFAGSGTTGHAVINLNREDGGQRKFILVEMADYFDTVLLPRLKKVTFTPEWKDGKPKRPVTKEETERSPRIFKYIRLESYEDTLNNLELRRTETQEQTLFSQATPQKFREEYILQYMLAVESRDSLLPIEVFRNPVDCKLTIKRPGSEESRRTNVDLLETFNWLIGISVEHIAAPQSFAADFVRDSEGRLKLKSPLKQEENGRWWFRRIEGTNPDGRKTLIVWRNLTGNLEEDNLVLDTYMSEKLKISTRDFEFDLIYVNGSNNLENLKLPDDTWKVRLIEEDFHHLMFEMEDV